MSRQFRQRVRATLTRVKEGRGGYDLPLEIMIYNEAGKQVGRLRPLGKRYLSKTHAKRLREWRICHGYAFPPSVTPITITSTLRWLNKHVVNNPERCLWYVYPLKGRTPIGHMGLATFDYQKNSCELDNILRGEARQRGLMSMAVRALILWTKHQLRPSKIGLRVMGDNEHAIRLYQQLGFKAVGSKTLSNQLRKMIYAE